MLAICINLPYDAGRGVLVSLFRHFVVTLLGLYGKDLLPIRKLAIQSNCSLETFPAEALQA